MGFNLNSQYICFSLHLLLALTTVKK